MTPALKHIAALALATTSVYACDFTQQFDSPPPPPGEDGGRDAGVEIVSAGTCGALDDPENCGECGHSCLGGACLDGACQPVVLASGQGDSAGGLYYRDDGTRLDGPDELVVDAEHVYWLNLRGELMRVALEGGKARRLSRAALLPHSLLLHEGSAYFSTFETGTLFRAPIEGGEAVQLTTASREARPALGLAVTEDQLFWVDGQTLRSCPKSGCIGDPRILTRAAGGAVAVAADRVYFSSYRRNSEGELVDFGLSSLYQSGFGNAEHLTVSLPTWEVVTTQQELFAITDLGIVRVRRQGAPDVQVLTSGGDLDRRNLALDPDYVYWTNLKEPGHIRRCSRDGCVAPEVVIACEKGCRDIAVDDDAIYWTEGDGRVLKLAKDRPADAMR